MKKIIFTIIILVLTACSTLEHATNTLMIDTDVVTFHLNVIETDDIIGFYTIFDGYPISHNFEFSHMTIAFRDGTEMVLLNEYSVPESERSFVVTFGGRDLPKIAELELLQTKEVEVVAFVIDNYCSDYDEVIGTTLTPEQSKRLMTMFDDVYSQ